MSLWKIAWRSIQQRALASSLTGISMALGVMLVVAVLVVHGVINQSFLNSDLGYNIVVGAKGGRLDLVLNSVYYLARPVENIPYSYYLEFTEGKFKPLVAKAIPLCLGDMYQDFRVIGTTPDFFNQLDYGGRSYRFAEGRNFEPDEYFGAVIGATVARETGLRKGSEFQPAHGAGPDAHVHDPFKVLGVLEPTGTPNDRALFINMEGFYLIPEHARPVDEDETAKPQPQVEHAHEEHAEHKPAEDAEHKHEEKHADEDSGHKHEDAEHKHEEHPDEQHAHQHKEAGHKHEDAGAEAQPVAEPQADAPHNENEKQHADEKAGVEHAHDERGAHDEKETLEPGHEDAHEAAAHDHAHEPGHDHGHAHEPLPLEQREVTSILVLTASVAGAPPELLAPGLLKQINKEPVAQAVLPIREMSTLFTTFVDPLRLVLLSLTVLIVIVSGIGILVSIYNSMSERRHEIAVIRALGAGRRTVMAIVLAESILLSLAGGLAGWVVGHGLIAALNPWIAQQTGVSIGFAQFVGYELVIIPGLIVLAAVVGYLPAMAAYRTDVAKALSATP
jgi:ABC-type lipoprotein release transport system permease subunit